MDVTMLIRDARELGLTLSIEDGGLVVEGPVTADAFARQLVANKGDVLAELDRERDAAVDRAETLGAAWRGACSELGELCGWPSLPFAPGRSVSPGPSPWRVFIRQASVPELQLLLAAARQRLDEFRLPTAVDQPDRSQMPAVE